MRIWRALSDRCELKEQISELAVENSQRRGRPSSPAYDGWLGDAGSGPGLLSAEPGGAVEQRSAVWTFRRGDGPRRFQIFTVEIIFRWRREPSSCNEPRKWSHYTFRVAR